MRRTLFAALAVLAAAPAHAAGIAVAMDEVRTVTFPKSVATIYVGNPTIADINMIDSRHAFILGKAFGYTNMVALDKNGDQVSNIPITVKAQNSVVTLNKGAAQFTMACTSARCEWAPTQGDEKTHFTNNTSEITTHQNSAKTSAASGAAGGGPGDSN